MDNITQRNPMTIIHHSFQRLFPGRDFPYEATLEYNRRLSRFNANILLSKSVPRGAPCGKITLKVRLNLEWKNIDDEIKIGLIQTLLLKVLREKKYTPNIGLYHNFVKSLPMLAEKKPSDSFLEKAFHRLNGQFFEGSMEMPTLVWGKSAFRKLASYNFHNDTITVSSVFKDAPERMLDYLVHHEMLHKHFAFTHRNGRSSYHSREFKTAEKLYPNHTAAEKELQAFLRQKKKQKFFMWKNFLKLGKTGVC